MRSLQYSICIAKRYSEQYVLILGIIGEYIGSERDASSSEVNRTGQDRMRGARKREFGTVSHALEMRESKCAVEAVPIRTSLPHVRVLPAQLL